MRFVEARPVLVRISAAKRLRDAAEREARQAGEDRVSVTRRRARAQATVVGGHASEHEPAPRDD